MTVQDVIFEADTWFGSKSQEQAVAVANSSDLPPGLVFAGPPLSLWRSPGGPHEMSLSVFDMDRYMVTFLVDGPELSHVRTVRPCSHAPPHCHALPLLLSPPCCDVGLPRIYVSGGTAGLLLPKGAERSMHASTQLPRRALRRLRYKKPHRHTA